MSSPSPASRIRGGGCSGNPGLPPIEPEPHVLIEEDLSLDRVFTPSEAELATQLDDWSRAGNEEGRQQLRRVLTQGYRSLGSLALALEALPSLRDTSRLGEHERSMQTLRDVLTRGGPHGLEWSLPSKAVVSRAFGITKVNFWTSTQYALHAAGGVQPSERVEALIQGIEEAIEEAVYTRLAEELYGSFSTSSSTSPEIKDAAVENVIDLWEGRVRFATYRFCPILRSAWAARLRAPRVFGTMLGTSELVQLLFRDCDQRFVDVFSSEEAGPGRIQAFEEFLFDLPFENLERVRARMEEQGLACIGPEQVAKLLGYSELRPLMPGAKALYTSFRQRRVKAQYRASMAGPRSPSRTAESYVLEALLRAEIADS